MRSYCPLEIQQSKSCFRIMLSSCQPYLAYLNPCHIIFYVLHYLINLIILLNYTISVTSNLSGKQCGSLLDGFVILASVQDLQCFQKRINPGSAGEELIADIVVP